MPNQKICKDCRTEGRAGKPLNIVFINGKPAPGPRCYRHHKNWTHAQAEKAASKRRAQIFGVTPELYAALLAVQGGGCAICGRKPRKGGRRLAVDHDHACCSGRTSCGKCVRMLACWSCNKFLHHIKDDPVTLERAAETLRNPPAWVVASTVRNL